MYLGFRQFKIPLMVAAVTAACAAQTSFAVEQAADCSHVLSGNVLADGTLANDTYHRGLIIPKGSTLGFDKACEASWADTVQAVNYKGVQLAAGKLTFSKEGHLQFAPLANSVLPNGASVFGAGQIKSGKATLSAEEKFKEEVFGKNVSAFFDTGFPKQAYLNRLSKIDGVWYTVGKDPITFNADGSVASAVLERNTKFGDFIIGPGAVRFDESGAIREGRLGVNTRVGDLVLPANTQLTLSQLGKIESFTLQSAMHQNQAEVEKVKLGPLWLFTNTSYSLNDSQHLVEFQTSDYTWFQERLYPPQTKIQLSADGVVEWDSYYSELANATAEQIEKGEFPEVLKHAQVLRGVYLPKGSLVFMAHGLAHSAAVPHNFKYADIFLQPGLIDFSNTHTVRGTLATNTVIHGVTIPEHAELEFYRSQLVRVDTESDLVVNEIMLDGRRVEFRDNGTLRSGVLAKLTIFDGVLYDAGTQLLFDANGAIIRAEFVGTKSNANDAMVADSQIETLHDFPSDDRCAAISQDYNGVRTDLFSVAEVRACKLIWASNELED